MTNKSSFTSHLPHTHTHIHTLPSGQANTATGIRTTLQGELWSWLRCWDEEEENSFWRGTGCVHRKSQSREGVCEHFHKAIEDAAWMLGMLPLPNKGTKYKGKKGDGSVIYHVQPRENKKSHVFECGGERKLWADVCVCVCGLTYCPAVQGSQPNILWLKFEDKPLNCLVQNIWAFKTSDNLLKAPMCRIKADIFNLVYNSFSNHLLI